MDSLFGQIESYTRGRENMLTEILAFILRCDRIARKRFIALLLNGNSRRVPCSLIEGSVETQCLVKDNKKVDLCIRGRKRNLYVEVKMWSDEGSFLDARKRERPQIDGYLEKMNPSTDRLAYLTPRGHPEPCISSTRRRSMYLGHIHWEQVHDILKDRCDGETGVIQNFLRYLEDNKMSGVEGFSTKEIKAGINSFSFLLKAENLLETLQDTHIGFIRTLFSDGRRADRSGYERGYQWGYTSWWYSTKTWQRSGLRLSFDVWSDGSDVHIAVSFYISRGRVRGEFYKHKLYKKKMQLLKEMGWELTEESSWWEAYKNFPLKAWPVKKIVEKRENDIRAALREFKSSRLIGLITRISTRK